MPDNSRNPSRNLLVTPTQDSSLSKNVRIKSKRDEESQTISSLVPILSGGDLELLLLLHNHFGHKGYDIKQIPHLKRTETILLLTVYYDELCFSNSQKRDIKRIAYILKFGKRPSYKVLHDIYGDAVKSEEFKK